MSLWTSRAQRLDKALTELRDARSTVRWIASDPHMTSTGLFNALTTLDMEAQRLLSHWDEWMSKMNEEQRRYHEEAEINRRPRMTGGG